MPRYLWADLGLSADFELPELAPAQADGSFEEWTVRGGDGRAPLDGPRRWFHRWRRPDGGRSLSFARHPGGYLLRFNGVADFDVRPDARVIHGYRAASTPDHTFNHLLLDQVLPLVAASGCRLALHASVVDVSGGAVAFLGATGDGKSTMAASMARAGYSVISDDCCVIRRRERGFDVLATYPGLRLFPEAIRQAFGEPREPLAGVSHYSTKQRIVPRPAGATDPAGHLALRAVYVLPRRGQLNAPTALRIARRSRREAVLDLVGGTFYLDVKDERRAREGFELAVAAASSCPVRVLTVPWDFTALDAAAAAVISDLASRDR